MTRAKERLFLTYARKRRIYGRLHERRPSPFINDVAEELKEREASGFKKPKEKHRQQLELF
jgi:DNA helicase-2/ATP-dependent DNA helicase PcrA